MTALVDHFVCDCAVGDGHRSGCVLGQAETIAVEASSHAAVHGDHLLVAAIGALVEAGILHDLDPVDTTDALLGILDTLYEAGLLQAVSGR